jgi:hypothetical protein
LKLPKLEITARQSLASRAHAFITPSAPCDSLCEHGSIVRSRLDLHTRLELFVIDVPMEHCLVPRPILPSLLSGVYNIGNAIMTRRYMQQLL